MTKIMQGEIHGWLGPLILGYLREERLTRFRFHRVRPIDELQERAVSAAQRSISMMSTTPESLESYVTDAYSDLPLSTGMTLEIHPGGNEWHYDDDTG